MGDQQRETVRGSLRFVPQRESRRILELDVDPAERARAFATAARLNVLYMIARAGSGHIGSSFSSLDIVTWLHLEVLGDDDVYFSSKGHDVPGLYSVLIGLGRLPEADLHRLRRLGGLPGHPDAGTPGIVTNTGSLGMGVSKAKGMVAANRLAGRDARVFVLTGDGELQEGQFWESLASATNARMHEITVIVDHNKLQSDTFVSDVSDLGDLEAKLTAFGWSVARCDGHDVAALDKALADRGDRPHAVIADSVKGRGISFMEHTAMAPGQVLYGFHSGAPDPEEYRAAAEELHEALDGQLTALGVDPVSVVTVEPPATPATSDARVHRLVDAYSRALVDHASRDPRIVALDADLVLDTGLIPFRERFPERFFECGIAEQDMVSQAGGMAANGLLPVVHSFACFLSTRPNEQIYNNATEHRRIVYVGSLAGLLPGGPGHSHQSVRDISAIAAVPDLVIVQPTTEEQTRRAADLAFGDEHHSYYLRLASVPVPLPFSVADAPLVVGRGQIVRGGDSGIAVATYGPVMLAEAYAAVEQVASRTGAEVALINVPFLNRLDGEWLAAVLEGVDDLVAVEDHYLTGGLGDLLGSRLSQCHSGTRLHRRGVTEVPRCGTNAEVLRAHRLDAASLAEDVVTIVGAR